MTDSPRVQLAREGKLRLSSAVTPNTVAALRKVMESEGVGLDEAFRRLIAAGKHLYDAVVVDGDRLLVHRPSTITEFTIL